MTKKHFAFYFGRFNPPTVDHAAVMAMLSAYPNHRIFASSAVDNKNNILEFEDKVALLKQLYPEHKLHIVDDPEASDVVSAAVYLYELGAESITVLAGQDRIRDIKKLLEKYNGVEDQDHGYYNFTSIKTHVVGRHDPDTATSGMSSYAARQAASEDNFEKFSSITAVDDRSLFEKFRKVKSPVTDSTPSWIDLKNLQKLANSLINVYRKLNNPDLSSQEKTDVKQRWADHDFRDLVRPCLETAADQYNIPLLDKFLASEHVSFDHVSSAVPSILGIVAVKASSKELKTVAEKWQELQRRNLQTSTVDEARHVVGSIKLSPHRVGQKIFHALLPKGGVIERIVNNILFVKSLQDEKIYRFDANQIRQPRNISEIAEASYPGNIGMMEIAKFYQIADNAQKALLKKLIDAGKKQLAWELIQQTTNTRLQGREFNLDEGWRDRLAQLGVATAIAAGGTAGLEIDKQINKYTQTEPQVVQVDKADKKPEPSAAKREIQKIKPNTHKEQHLALTPLTDSYHESFLSKKAKQAGIQGIELAAFIAQCAHESRNFEALAEEGDAKEFRKYDIKYNTRLAKILGNVKSGDGELYKGRGYIHLTGRYNYRIAGQALGIPLEEKPWLASKPEIAAKIAIWYWKTRVQPVVTDFSDVEQVTKPINPKLNGLSDRTNKFNKIVGHYKIAAAKAAGKVTESATAGATSSGSIASVVNPQIKKKKTTKTNALDSQVGLFTGQIVKR